jgi:type VI secretion system secreted protein Hcp
MAFDAFLKLDGIKGESTDKTHAGEIEIHSFSWGVSNTGTFASGGGGSTGKATFQDFSFTTEGSSASPQMFLSAAMGKHIPEAVLTLRKAGEKPLDYYVIKLSDVLISGYQQAGASGAQTNVPLDEFSLNYSKIDISYTSQKADGSSGDISRAGYDVKLNTKV